MTGALRGVGVKVAEPSAIVEEVIKFQCLIANRDNIAVEPGLVDDVERFLVEVPDIHTEDFCPDLWAQLIDLHSDNISLLDDDRNGLSIQSGVVTCQVSVYSDICMCATVRCNARYRPP